MQTIPDNFYQSLLMINNLLFRESTRAGLFKCMTTILQPLVRCDRCSLSLYAPQTDSLTWFAQAEGVNITAMDATSVPLRGPLALQAIRDKKHVVVHDLSAIDDPAVRHMVNAGLKSSVALPLLSQNEPLGALIFSYMRPIDKLDAPLVRMLQQIAGQVSLAVDNILAHDKLKELNRQLMHQVGSLLHLEDELYAEKNFFWQCESMRHVVEQAASIAASDVPVLVMGETGVGKEFVARYIHNHSKRKKNAFVKLNCPSLPPSLFESELFGHAKGAFTGADKLRVGRLEAADKGSLLLDEIGELDRLLQAKLLQVLQDACFERVGESTPVRVNIRFIASTNADLHTMMNQGLFRRDLFYRLAGAVILVPPLRERKGEILKLFGHLLRQHSVAMDYAPFKLSPAAGEIINAHPWPGNVRELTNVVKRLLILYPGMEVQADMLCSMLENTLKKTVARQDPAPLPHTPPLHTDCLKLADSERALIEKALVITNGMVSGKKGACTLLNVPRSTLVYKIKKHNINLADYTCGAGRR